MTTELSPPPIAAPASQRHAPSLARDLPASLVVFLVALPLSLGIALASNAPIMAGVIAAVTGGIVVGLLGGAPLQVSGPAAGLTAVVFGMVEQCQGDWRMVTALVAAAGVLQLGLGFLGIARWALAISPAVVPAMLSGIGVLITLGQLQVLLGGAPQSSAIGNLKALPRNLADPNLASAALGVATAAVIFAWPLLGKRASRVPAALVGVVLLTLASLPLGESVERIHLTPKGAEADLLDAIALPKLPTIPLWDQLMAVLVLAMIASVESLLCAVATDKLHDGPRARLDRELMGQGAANTLSGLLGGLPITGVIVRSKANIDAGGSSRWSAVLHGVWLLIFVVLLGALIENIPKAVLAGLLITVGVRLVNLSHIQDSLRHGEGIPYAVTVGGILLRDLLAGVVAGFVVGAVVLLHRLTSLKVVVTQPQEREKEGDRAPIEVSIEGALTFRGVPELTSRLGKIHPGSPVRLVLKVRFIDHAGWEALHGWRTGHERTGARVMLDGLGPAVPGHGA